MALALVGARAPSIRVRALLDDEAEVRLYMDHRLTVTRVCDLAAMHVDRS
jgi:hypothetical protein